MKKHRKDQYENTDDDVICIGWAILGWALFLICMIGFIIVEVAW